MTKLYQEAMASLQTPDALIGDTRQKLLCLPDKTGDRRRWRRGFSMVATAAAVSTALCLLPQTKPIHENLGVSSTVAETFSGEEALPSLPQGVIFNSVSGELLYSFPVFHGPFTDRLELWSYDEFCALLGFSPLPAVLPKGMMPIEPVSRQMAFCGERRVDFYNTWIFTYQDGQRQLTVAVNPSFIPYWSAPRGFQLKDTMQPEQIEALLSQGDQTDIGGVMVTLWELESGTVYNYQNAQEPEVIKGYLCADFSYRGAGFTVTAQGGVSKEEFFAVLQSMIAQ